MITSIKDVVVVKKMLRLPLPSKMGIKYVKCPKCNKRLTVLCLRKLKVEFVKG